MSNKKYFTSATLLILIAAASLIAPHGASAQQFVYTPENPAFGGAAINYSWMLSSAQAQMPQEENQFNFNRDPLEDFQSSLQRQILNQLSRQIVEGQFGGPTGSIDLTQEGRFDLGQFVVEVTPGLNGLNIRVFDVFSGDETTITIPNL